MPPEEVVPQEDIGIGKAAMCLQKNLPLSALCVLAAYHKGNHTSSAHCLVPLSQEDALVLHLRRRLMTFQRKDWDKDWEKVDTEVATTLQEVRPC